jgi:GNAT superfamily N-acetyltransferase
VVDSAVVVRPAVARDVKPIAELWEALVDMHHALDAQLPQAVEGGAAQYARRIEDQLGNPMARVLVADHDGRVIGYVLGVVVDLLPDMFAQEPSGFLADIYVDERYRGGGVGRELVEHLSQWFADHHIRYFEWHVASQNRDAFDFWESLGGRPVMVRMRASVPISRIRP